MGNKSPKLWIYLNRNIIQSNSFHLPPRYCELERKCFPTCSIFFYFLVLLMRRNIMWKFIKYFCQLVSGAHCCCSLGCFPAKERGYSAWFTTYLFYFGAETETDGGNHLLGRKVEFLSGRFFQREKIWMLPCTFVVLIIFGAGMILLALLLVMQQRLTPYFCL